MNEAAVVAKSGFETFLRVSNTSQRLAASAASASSDHPRADQEPSRLDVEGASKKLMEFLRERTASVETVVAETGWNPEFVQSCVRYLQSQGLVAVDDQTIELTPFAKEALSIFRME